MIAVGTASVRRGSALRSCRAVRTPVWVRSRLSPAFGSSLVNRCRRQTPGTGCAAHHPAAPMHPSGGTSGSGRRAVIMSGRGLRLPAGRAALGLRSPPSGSASCRGSPVTGSPRNDARSASHLARMQSCGRVRSSGNWCGSGPLWATCRSHRRAVAARQRQAGWMAGRRNAGLEGPRKATGVTSPDAPGPVHPTRCSSGSPSPSVRCMGLGPPRCSDWMPGTARTCSPPSLPAGLERTEPALRAALSRSGCHGRRAPSHRIEKTVDRSIDASRVESKHACRVPHGYSPQAAGPR